MWVNERVNDVPPAHRHDPGPELDHNQHAVAERNRAREDLYRHLGRPDPDIHRQPNHIGRAQNEERVRHPRRNAPSPLRRTLAARPARERERRGYPLSLSPRRSASRKQLGYPEFVEVTSSGLAREKIRFCMGIYERDRAKCGLVWAHTEEGSVYLFFEDSTWFVGPDPLRRFGWISNMAITGGPIPSTGWAYIDGYLGKNPWKNDDDTLTVRELA